MDLCSQCWWSFIIAIVKAISEVQLDAASTCVWMILLWSHVVTTWSTCQPIQFKLPFLFIYNKSPSSFCKFLYIGYMLLVRVKTDPFANSQPWCGWSCVWPVCFLYFRGRLVFCLMKYSLNQKRRKKKKKKKKKTDPLASKVG